MKSCNARPGRQTKRSLSKPNVSAFPPSPRMLAVKVAVIRSDYIGSPWSESLTMVSSGFFVLARLVGSLIKRLSKRSAVLPIRNRHSPVRHYEKILLRG
jgi:hypothetical protein